MASRSKEREDSVPECLDEERVMPMMSTTRVSWVTLMPLLVLGGCAGVTFTEADLGRVKEVHVGSSFTISLPHHGEWKKPRLNEVVAKFLNHRLEGSAERDVFAFRAEQEGLTDIFISAIPPGTQDLDFTMRVRVLGEEETTLSDEWNDRWNWTRSGPRDRD